MSLRPGRPDDVVAIRAVARRAYIKYVPRIGRAPAPMIADFQEHLADDDVTVATLDNRVVGYLIGFAKMDAYFVENVAVDPDAAGHGFGKALMLAAEEAAKKAGKEAIALYTNVRMFENFPFYAALGYRVTHHIRESGFRRVYLEKRLDL